jgi:hypothetical protein
LTKLRSKVDNIFRGDTEKAGQFCNIYIEVIFARNIDHRKCVRHSGIATPMTAASDQTIVRLMAIPPAQHDLDWLQQALQAAILLELSTIPPYLCGLWSIKSGNGPVYDLVEGVVFEEMLHMGLACNMLTAIGGIPQIVNGYRDRIKYPGKLPGGVRQDLTVYLAGLSKPYVQEVYMGIETPEHGDIVHLAVSEQFPTIGSFYSAVLAAFIANNPSFRPDRQLTATIHQEPLFKIATIGDVTRAINEIKEQGEGTSQSPFATTNSGSELAHYYRFKEIVVGKTVVQDPKGGFTFGDPSIPFPDVFPMLPVPLGGYPNTSPAVTTALKTFNDTFTTVLTKLDSAWATGSQADLGAAVGAMFDLEGPASALLMMPLPDGTGVYGPDFRLT